jgi:diaminopimelate epimerase
MKFTKMHGLGNDYIYVDTFEERVPEPAALAIEMSRPHFGVGADGLVLIGPSSEADFAMRMFNADGSEGEMCGNAARCVARYVHDRGLTARTSLTLATRAGIRRLELELRDGRVDRVTVDLGVPALSPASVPVDVAGTEAVRDHPLSISGQLWRITCVGMGNPHAVVFVEDPQGIDVAGIGRQIETHPLFPKRSNVEFVHVVQRDRLEMRVWERGSGETLACGTGAAAALVAGVLNGLCERSATVELAGGALQVTWDARDDHVYQRGPASFVFDGVWPGA